MSAGIEERRKVAKDLRMLASLDRGTRGAFSETVGETVAVTMGIADFEDFADVLERFADVLERFADLIEPTQLTCSFRWVGDEMQCSACGWLVTEHDADFEYYVTENTAKAFRYCPFCGCRVVEK